jgi:aconitate hydratase
MAQKILAGRAADPTLAGPLVQAKVDQVVLARAPHRAWSQAVADGLKKTAVEVAIAYDGRCIAQADDAIDVQHGQHATSVSPGMLAHGIVVARPGVGFPAPVHLERFASPARLCVTDDPRLAGVGGIGMLTIVAAPGQLAQALVHGSVWLRPPRSVQVVLNGRVRPFVCARDVALELLRRGLAEVVRRVEAAEQAPVVLEFVGPSVRLLSVSERACLSALAPRLGAAAAIFASDERTEVFLRDQRRSKAHRALSPDAGAPFADVVQVDLAAVDPLLLDESGHVRSVRDLAGRSVSQVVLGGDGGATLRDMLAAATLLKSKRVPPQLEFLVAPPSRQMLEVMAAAGALADLIAAGARLVEPDARLTLGELYPPASGTERDDALTSAGPAEAAAPVSLRTFEGEPRVDGAPPFVVGSAETLAYAVATGEIGDPRSFKRPVRVMVPRALPTDDVLLLRERRAGDLAKKDKAVSRAPAREGWVVARSVSVVGAGDVRHGAARSNGGSDASSTGGEPPMREVAVVCRSLDEVRDVVGRAAHAVARRFAIRAVIAPFIPSGTVSVLRALGIAALGVEESDIATLSACGAFTLPPPPSGAVAEAAPRGDVSADAEAANDPPRPEPRDAAAVVIALGHASVTLHWLARGVERTWAREGGVSVSTPSAARAARPVRTTSTRTTR